MHSILLKIKIETSPEALYNALSTQAGLSSWWTRAEQEGENFHFFFGPDGGHRVTMRVISSTPGREVRWQCVNGPWVEKGEFVFLLETTQGGVYLDFAHHGWPETDDFYKHCNAKWGFFLVVSLKDYLETGSGLPHPNDPSI